MLFMPKRVDLQLYARSKRDCKREFVRNKNDDESSMVKECNVNPQNCGWFWGFDCDGNCGHLWVN